MIVLKTSNQQCQFQWQHDMIFLLIMTQLNLLCEPTYGNGSRIQERI
jgi:hypothetical protein